MRNRIKGYAVLAVFLLLMLAIHQYVFIYADDFYYARDALAGASYLPNFVLKELNSNGRVWVHVLLLGILRYDVYIFRIINPVVIMLTALLMTKISIGSSTDEKEFLIAGACLCILFLFLPVEITHTTIYYAATSLNYLYPTSAAMLYVYSFYYDYCMHSSKYKARLGIVVLAFFAGSSTQQAGMISIGFTILITLYLKVFRKIEFHKGFIPYYFALFTGYGIVTYGSVKRMLFERSVGNDMNLPATINGLLKTNIFSIPSAGYVLVVCLCCVFWLYYYCCENKGISKAAAASLSIGALGYVYIVLYKRYNVDISQGEFISTFYIAFTLVYVISIVYVSLLILLKEHYPFLLFCTINAIGAQMMLIVADPRFAGTYKIMFPSLLLMSIFIAYSFVKFYHNNLFLSLAMLALAASLFARFYHSEKFLWFIRPAVGLGFTESSVIIITMALAALLLLGVTFLKNSRILGLGLTAAIAVLALSVYGITYRGYKSAAFVQNLNINSIREYHKSADKTVLKLRKTSSTTYGYNVGNWNDMPYFMKQYYKIDEGTGIDY